MALFCTKLGIVTNLETKVVLARPLPMFHYINLPRVFLYTNFGSNIVPNIFGGFLYSEPAAYHTCTIDRQVQHSK